MTSLDHVTFVYLLDPAAAEAPDLPAAALSQQQHIKIPSNKTNPTYYALLLLAAPRFIERMLQTKCELNNQRVKHVKHLPL